MMLTQDGYINPAIAIFCLSVGVSILLLFALRNLRNYALSNLMKSVIHRADKVVSHHCRTNPTLRNKKYTWHEEILSWMLREEHANYIILGSIIIPALAFASVLAYGQWFPEYFRQMRLADIDFQGGRQAFKDINSYILATQVVITGIIFPIALSLLSLIFQKESSSGSNSLIQVYYSESFATGVGAAGIGLLITATLQFVWIAEEFLHQFGVSYGARMFTANALVIYFMMLWLILNVLATWRFLGISIGFTHPARRREIVEQYSANHSIPRHLRDRVSESIYLVLQNSVATNSSAQTSVLLGYSIGRGENEITRTFGHRRRVTDLWEWPLSWAIASWRNREEKTVRPDRAQAQRPSLIIPVRIGQSFDDQLVIARLYGGAKLNFIERVLISISIRTSRIKNEHQH